MDRKKAHQYNASHLRWKNSGIASYFAAYSVCLHGSDWSISLGNAMRAYVIVLIVGHNRNALAECNTWPNTQQSTKMEFNIPRDRGVKAFETKNLTILVISASATFQNSISKQSSSRRKVAKHPPKSNDVPRWLTNSQTATKFRLSASSGRTSTNLSTRWSCRNNLNSYCGRET